MIDNQSFHQFTEKLNKNSCVYFAFYAAKLVQTFESINCVNLVEKYLKHPESVTVTELRAIANASYNHANSNSVWAASYAAYVAAHTS